MRSAALIRLHKWTGLVLAGWLVLQSCTGLAILFRHDLNRIVHRGVLTVQPQEAAAPVDEWVAAALRVAPAALVERIDYPLAAGDAALLTLREGDSGARRLVAVDPYRAAVTAHGGLARFPIEAAFWWHSHLLMPPFGKLIVGALGLVTAAMLVTGVIIWWPKGRRFARALRIVRTAGRPRLLLDLHRVPGALLASFALFVVATGMLLSFSDSVARVVALVLPLDPPPHIAPPGQATATPLASVEESVAAARARVPLATVRDVRFPPALADTVQVLLREHPEPIPRAVRQVWVSRAGPAVLGELDPARQASGNRLLRWFLPLHSGHFLGAAGIAVVALAGVCLLILSLTGLWMWSARRALRVAQAHASRARRSTDSAAPEALAGPGRGVPARGPRVQ